MALAVGTRLGPYEVTGPLGAGGMGEVYKARDTRLDRDVAIKVLPAIAIADAERRSRFEREAKAVAALNHPNIVTIHAVEEADGVPFFTMEYVDGPTLRDLIPSRGLPLDQFLRIAIPVTDAVAAAHQRGILHRDLKPANVMLTAEGRVKVLDFGLAKLKESVQQPVDSWQPTAEATGEGRILGTVAYMSPEQAEGKPLDQRSDVFSLGVLLYEMATGQRPFKGDTGVSLISAILKDTPGSVTDLRPDLPRELGRILKRALHKDPEHRYQTAKDLRNDLETLKEDLDSGEIARTASIPGPVPRVRRLWTWAVLLVVIGGLVGGGAWWTFHSRSAAQPSPPLHLFSDFAPTLLTTEGISEYAVAVSPDGRYVAYAFIEGGREGLRVRQADASATLQAVAPGDVLYFGVTFSPDGNRLYYVAYPRTGNVATLYEVDVLGGVPRRLVYDVDRDISFSPDGARFAFVRGLVGKGQSAIMIANKDGTGEHALVTRSAPSEFLLVNPAWSPDGRRIAVVVYDGSKAHLATVDAQTGAVQTIGRRGWDTVSSIAWPHNEPHLVIAAADFSVSDVPQLWDVVLPDGTATRITRDIASYSRVSLTADARTLVTVRAEAHGTLWTASAKQPDRVARIAAVPDTVVQQSPIRWTPDGRIVYTADVGGNYDIWAVKPDGTEQRQLTTAAGRDNWPSVAPDGRSIAFVSDRDGSLRVWRMDADGGGQAVVTHGDVDFFPVIAADGRHVFYMRWDQPTGPLYLAPLDGGPPTLLSRPATSPAPAASWDGAPNNFFPDELSPDGSLLLGSYFDEQEARSRVAIVPASGHGPVRKLDIRLPFALRTACAWAPDGRSITFVRTSDGATNLWRQPLDGGPPTRLTHFTGPEDIVAHAWSRDGKMLALVRGVTERHLVMMKDVANGK